jgi:hypothetical protein
MQLLHEQKRGPNVQVPTATPSPAYTTMSKKILTSNQQSKYRCMPCLQNCVQVLTQGVSPY